MKKQENPAKAFLRRYRALCGRVDALQRAIDEAMQRAMNTSITLKEIKVLSSPAEHDPMARDVATAVDACEILYAEKEKAQGALREILSAIDALMDERQKEIITRRYINGDEFNKICVDMSYSEPTIYVLHGRALVEVNKWLERRGKRENIHAEKVC
jgi:DNA-directed RNA polymerase specialized sigma24 family protein